MPQQRVEQKHELLAPVVALPRRELRSAEDGGVESGAPAPVAAINLPPGWYTVYSSLSMLLSIVLTAICRLARRANVPVLIAHGEDRAVLELLAPRRARALAAMASDDLDNVEIAIAALAVAPGLRMVLRAGESDVIAETRSLFSIGRVCDVSAATVMAVISTC